MVYFLYMGRKPKDITGLKVGVVTVLEKEQGKDSGQTLWKCLCSCGVVFMARYCTLTVKIARKKPYSCGCLCGRGKGSKDMVAKKKLTMSASRGLYGQYCSRAKFKNIVFTLSIEEFENLTSKNCAYCGIPPQQSYLLGRHSQPNEYKYNGIDRIDSKKGYVLSNCAPCCVKCNRMKLNHSTEDFVKHVQKIAEYTRENGLVSLSYKDFKSWAVQSSHGQ